ncbi:MAG: nitroreductase/quinone reductase family protein [Mycobacterium sp.]|uniref:nitroreductase/quinone reductase family protein n=1 Tax=Mycobacterium sp. TaxID=1785 RepID=UPI003C42A93E
MSDSTINGIPRVDPRAGRAAWKRGLARLTSTKPGAAVHRTIAAPLDAAVMKITGGRANLAVGAMPLVVLASTGARSGQLREVPLGYFTDGDDVILIASNYGGVRHPGWYHNLVTDPQCELHIGPRGGRFVARETESADHDRLFDLAVDFYPGYAKYAERVNGIRAIRILRLSPR